jgi:FG-GAP-like repeat
MKLKQASIIISIAFFIFAQNIFSASKTWTGNGANANFSNPANWVGNAGAVAGDDLIFPAVANQYSLFQDLIVTNGNTSTYYRSLTFEGGNYVIGGTALAVTNGVTISGGNQNLGQFLILNPTIFIAENASVTARFNQNRSDFTIDGPGTANFTLFFSLGNSYVKQGTGATNFDWTGGSTTQRITVNSGRFVARGGLSVGVANEFIVNGGIVEGTLGAPTTTIFNGSNAEYKPSLLTISFTNLQIINGAKFSPSVCNSSSAPLTSINLTGAVFNPLFTNCSANVINLLALFGSTTPVTGFFNGYPEGSTLTIGGKVYRMTYRGGDGNDVQLIGSTKPSDFDGDGKTDYSIFRPSNGQWWYLQSSDNSSRTFQFGVATDKLVPADYTGDGKTDIAVYRPSTGEWFILRSEDLSYYAFPFGISTDTPVPADYDGDGRSDPAVYRSSNSTFYILKSTGGLQITPFGLTGDRVVPADYDGDGKADIAIYRSSGGLGQWWITRSSDGSVLTTFAGFSNVPLLPADFTGDGKADFAYFVGANTTWNYVKSEDLAVFSLQFGQPNDILVPGDYDGDGKSDFASFRPSINAWNIRRSSDGTAVQQTFGASGDIPVPSAFIR